MRFYMQRMRLCEKVGFNYDYMGSAEYEFGATMEGRLAIAKAFIEGDIKSRLIEVRDEQTSVELLMMARSEFVDSMGDIMDFGRLKEPMHLLDKWDTVAWLSVKWEQPTPLFLVRPHVKDIQRRVNRFFEPAIQHLKETA